MSIHKQDDRQTVRNTGTVQKVLYHQEFPGKIFQNLTPTDLSFFAASHFSFLSNMIMSKLTTFCTMASPLGPLHLAATHKGLVYCAFTKNLEQKKKQMAYPEGDGSQAAHDILQQAQQQLSEYFDGTRRDFDVPVAPQGTEFQESVWKALQEVPYGSTASYSDISVSATGNARACRAVGMANNRNPISIIIPCHRVIGKDGSMVGYGGGLDKKTSLLELEKNDKKEDWGYETHAWQ